MEKNKILFIDTETGGLNPTESSLLSIGLVVWHNGNIIDSKEFFIKDRLFRVTPQSIKVNKIDLLSLLNTALEPPIVLDEIKEFCIKYFESELPITLGGHNVNFDVGFLKQFMSENGCDFADLFSHRFIDTASILKFLYYAGKIDSDISSSDNAFNYFNINIEKRHSALGDAIGTATLFSHLIKLFSV